MEEVASGLWLQGELGFQEAEKRALHSLFHLTRAFSISYHLFLPHVFPFSHDTANPNTTEGTLSSLASPSEASPPSSMPEGILELMLSQTS